MKKIICVVLMSMAAACGDNITLPEQPDAAEAYPVPHEPEVAPRDPDRPSVAPCCTFSPPRSCWPKHDECVTYACPVGPVEYCSGSDD